MSTPESEKNSAKFGYIIRGSRTPGTEFALGPIAEDGDYSIADADEINLAVYPSREAAESAMLRACKSRDPLVFDGLSVIPAWIGVRDMLSAAQCAVFGFLTYPAGNPERTDWDAIL